MTLNNVGQPTLDLFASTIAAVAECWPLVGSGDKHAVDRAAVDAMRHSLTGADFGGVVVIGEGVKDEAPMLFNGELIGQGQPLDWDVAVDPVDGTALAASADDGAVSVIAATQRGHMIDFKDVYYMKKIISGAEGRGVLDIDKSPAENIRAIAEAKDISVTDVRVAVIDKPRNKEVIEAVEACGATWVQFAEGDIAMAVAAATSDSGVDMLLGVGGTPEGVVTACAVQVLGGFMQGRLAPQTPDQLENALAAGHDLEKKLELDDMVSGERFIFVMTGITDGLIVRGVRENGDSLEIQSFLLDSSLEEGHILEVSVNR